MHWILVSGWTIYFSFHSFFARKFVKQYVQDLGISAKVYRLIYNSLSLIGLLAILRINQLSDDKLLVHLGGLFRVLSLLLAIGGVLIIWAAFRQYSLSQFLGLSKESSTFHTMGILQYVRHPIYSGTISIVLAYLLFDPSISTAVSAACIFIYLAIGIYLEERQLTSIFGNAYVKYKKKVPAVFPRIF